MFLKNICLYYVYFHLDQKNKKFFLLLKVKFLYLSAYKNNNYIKEVYIFYLYN